jgi:hypothetical protein
MQAYRLRIELPDRPGALAALGTIVARHDANIVSVDIHEVEGPTAIDDIVVHVPDGWEPGRLSAALTEASTATLLSAQRLSVSPDAVLATLRSCVAMLRADADGLDRECVAALALVSPGSIAWLAEPAAAGRIEAGRLALERAESTILRSADLGDRSPKEGDAGWLSEPGWVLAAPDDHLEPTVVAFVARPASLRFSSTEVERVEALLRFRRTLTATRS